MVVAKIELWPHGVQDKAKPLGVVMIANDGQGDAEHGSYDVALSHAGKYWGKPGAWKSGHIERYRRTLSPYHLVARALAACGIR